MLLFLTDFLMKIHDFSPRGLMKLQIPAGVVRHRMDTMDSAPMSPMSPCSPAYSSQVRRTLAVLLKVSDVFLMLSVVPEVSLMR